MSRMTRPASEPSQRLCSGAGLGGWLFFWFKGVLMWRRVCFRLDGAAAAAAAAAVSSSSSSSLSLSLSLSLWLFARVVRPRLGGLACLLVTRWVAFEPSSEEESIGPAVRTLSSGQPGRGVKWFLFSKKRKKRNERRPVPNACGLLCFFSFSLSLSVFLFCFPFRSTRDVRHCWARVARVIYIYICVCEEKPRETLEPVLLCSHWPRVHCKGRTSLVEGKERGNKRERETDKQNGKK